MYYFASDLHLGLSLCGADSSERERLFVKWLDEVAVDAKAIFLVGDIFDFWFEYGKVVPKGYTRLLGKLSELTDHGVEIHHFAGNHDMWSFDYLQSECGVKLHSGAYEIIELYGKQVFIGHGDILGKLPFIPWLITKVFRAWWAKKLFYIFHPDISYRFAQGWSGSSRKAKPIKHTFRGEEDCIVKFAREFLKTQNVDLFVCGHIHCAEILELNNSSSIAFLGEWIESPTYGVLSESGFELRKY